MASPPTTRHTMRSGTEKAVADPTELMTNITAPSTITRRLSPAVRQPPRVPGADRAAQQSDGDDKAGEERAEMEMRAQSVDRAVDDGRVEAEKKTADRGGNGDAYSFTATLGCVCEGSRLRHEHNHLTDIVVRYCFHCP